MKGSKLFAAHGADVVITEFFDYNCGYCKRALPDIQTILEEDPNVRFVFKEMPILSQSSFEAAKWALAAHEQDMYFDFHSALMTGRYSKNVCTVGPLFTKLICSVFSTALNECQFFV